MFLTFRVDFVLILMKSILDSWTCVPPPSFSPLSSVVSSRVLDGTLPDTGTGTRSGDRIDGQGNMEKELQNSWVRSDGLSVTSRESGRGNVEEKRVSVEESSVQIIMCRICEKHVFLTDLKRHSILCLEKANVSISVDLQDEKLFRSVSHLQSITSMLNLGVPEQALLYNLLSRLIEIGNRVREINVEHSVEWIERFIKCSHGMQVFVEKHSHRLDKPLTNLFTITHQAISEKCFVALDGLKRLYALAAELNIQDLSLNCVIRLKGYHKTSSDPHISSRDEFKDTIPEPDKNLQKLPRVCIQDFEMIKSISRGADGAVFLAQKKTTRDFFAVKVLKKKLILLKKHLNHAHEEQDVLTTANNPFVVKLYYTFHSQGNVYMVMEYHPGGDCFSLLRNVNCLSCEHACSYLADVVLALEYLHGIGIVHRDLKPDNLLISRGGHLKLTDFGLSSMYGTLAKHIIRFSHVIDKFIALLSDPVALRGSVSELISKHIGYNVIPRHFSFFKITFLDILASKLQHRFTDFCKQAWSWFFEEFIVKEMYSQYNVAMGTSLEPVYEFSATPLKKYSPVPVFLDSKKVISPTASIEARRSFSSSEREAEKSILSSNNADTVLRNVVLNQELTKKFIDVICDTWAFFKSAYSVLHTAKVLFVRLCESDDSIADLFQDRFGSCNSNLANGSNASAASRPHALLADLKSSERAVGTADYIAPEMLIDSLSGNGPHADIWSFGVIMFEFLSGITPFHGTTQSQVYENIGKCEIDWTLLPADVTEEAISLLKRILIPSISDRITIPEIKKHPFFSHIDWNHHVHSDSPFIPQLDSLVDTSYFDPRQEFFPMNQFKLPNAKKFAQERIEKSAFSRASPKERAVLYGSPSTLSISSSLIRVKTQSAKAAPLSKELSSRLFDKIASNSPLVSKHISPYGKTPKVISPGGKSPIVVSGILKQAPDSPYSSQGSSGESPLGSDRPSPARRFLSNSHFEYRSRTKQSNSASNVKMHTLPFTTQQALIWNPEYRAEVCDWFWQFISDEKPIVIDCDVLNALSGQARKSFNEFYYVAYANLHELNLKLCDGLGNI